MPLKGYWWLISIVLLGGILRFMALNVHSLQSDELLSMQVSNPEYSLGEVAQLYRQCDDSPPPAYNFLLNCWFKLSVYNEAWARVLSILFGLASIVVVYFLGAYLFDFHTGVLSAFITAISYYLVYYSLDVSLFSTLFFLTALSYFLFIRALQRPVPLNLGAYAFVTLLLLITHYFALLVFISQGLVWFMVNWKRLLQDQVRHYYVVITFVLIILCFLPFAGNFIHSFSDGAKKEGGSGNDYFFVNYFVSYFGGSGLAVLPASVALLVFVSRVFNQPEPDQEPEDLHKFNGLIVLVWMSVPVILAYIRTILGTHLLSGPYFIIIVPALILAVARGMLEVRNIVLRPVLGLLFVAGSFINLVFIKGFYSGNVKDDYKGVAGAIAASSLSAKPIVYSDKNYLLEYYLRQTQLQAQLYNVSMKGECGIYSGVPVGCDVLIADTSVNDFWVCSAGASTMDRMRELSAGVMSTALFFKTDSFAGTNAFAHHYVRKSWNEFTHRYPFAGRKTILFSDFITEPDQLLENEGRNYLVIWSGELLSKDLRLSPGIYKLSVYARASMAHDTFPGVEVRVNGSVAGIMRCSDKDEKHSFLFGVTARDSVSSLGFKLLNDLYNPDSGEDRNVFISQITLSAR